MIEPDVRKGLRTWVEINKKAIGHNYTELQKILPKNVKFMSVVKSNAYGHHLVDFSLETQKLGIDYFGVDSIVEAITLRESGIIKPILVLGYTLPEMLQSAHKFDVEITISSFETLEEIYKRSFLNKIKVHIKVDTGLHRQGFLEEQMQEVMKTLKSLNSKVEVVGVYTHFAGVKSREFEEYTQKQLSLFKVWVKEFKKNNFSVIAHASASGGVLVFPEANFDMVRFGIAQYGIFPSENIENFCKGKIDLKPVLEWKTIISEIKNLPKGNKIGYDLTEELTVDSVVAICPVGYWHGFPRNLSSKGYVLTLGKRAKILGRVSMDMIVIDVTEAKGAKVGDVVTLIGQDCGEVISAGEVALTSNISVYEFLTRINPLIKRIYILVAFFVFF